MRKIFKFDADVLFKLIFKTRIVAYFMDKLDDSHADTLFHLTCDVCVYYNDRI